MPAIQTELRIQAEGGRMLTRREPIQVSSCETFSFQVKGVPPVKPAKRSKNQPARKSAKQEVRTVLTTIKPKLSNVKFVAVYDGGQGGGLKVRVGADKMRPLSETIVLMDRAARAFGSRPVIVVENTSPSPRTVMMLVGSDLGKEAQNSKVVVTKVKGSK